MKSIFRSRRNKSPHQNEEAEKKEAPFFSKENTSTFFSGQGAVQTKLTVGQPGDKYEKEADAVADTVVNNAGKPQIQNKEIGSIQRESLATPQEDEKLGTAEQRMEEDKLVQEQPEVQRMEAPKEEEKPALKTPEKEEEMVSKKDEPGIKEEDKEKEPTATVQTKSNVPANSPGPTVAKQLKSKAGKGRSLPKNTRAELGASLGADFGSVNVHTDTDAVDMNQELGAQAFTHGQDIYFNQGKYDPSSTEGKRLLAHELTHVVQQKGAEINKKDKKSESLISTSHTIQALRCVNTGSNVAGAAPDQSNPIDARAERIITFAQDDSIAVSDRAVGIVTQILCNYFPQEAQKVHNIKYVAAESGLHVISNGRGENTTGEIEVGTYFTQQTTTRHFARRVLQVFHELTHIDQYRQGLTGANRSDQREFLAFCAEALGSELEGTGRMQHSNRLSLVDAALGYYNCLSTELQTQYSEHKSRLLTKRTTLTNSSRIREDQRNSQPPSNCTR